MIVLIQNRGYGAFTWFYMRTANYVGDNDKPEQRLEKTQGILSDSDIHREDWGHVGI